MNSHHKGQWRGALMFSLICAWINDWANNGEAGDLRRHRTHYDVTVMKHRPATKVLDDSPRIFAIWAERMRQNGQRWPPFCKRHYKMYFPIIISLICVTVGPTNNKSASLQMTFFKEIHVKMSSAKLRLFCLSIFNDVTKQLMSNKQLKRCFRLQFQKVFQNKTKITRWDRYLKIRMHRPFSCIFPPSVVVYKNTFKW